MFKSPFSFNGRIRRIEYFLSCLLGGAVTAIAYGLFTELTCLEICLRIVLLVSQYVEASFILFVCTCYAA